MKRHILSMLLIVGLYLVGCSSPTDDRRTNNDQPDTGAADVITEDTGSDAAEDTAGEPDVVSEPDVADEDTTTTDTGTPDTGEDATSEDADTAPPLPPTAREYCDTTREMFCDYYMRCDRMHAESYEQCLTYFDETCNAVYAPHYITLEDEGLLSLSEEGMEACAAHLETVECNWQIFDLDGPCEAVWQGLALPTTSCGVGIASFVCESGSTCVINQTLCGTCMATVDVGEACGEGAGRCDSTATCVDGLCVERARPGDACGEGQPCALGASCTEGVCARFEVVAVGQSCGANQRCPYNAVCMGGVCQPQMGIGEACVQPGQCRSGYCNMDDGECAELKAPGESCGFAFECVSGSCREGECGPMLSSCFQ